MHTSLETLLGQECRLTDWHPSPAELDNISAEISEALHRGEKITRADCQFIVASHCDSVRMLLVKSVDERVLNQRLSETIRTGQ